MDCGLRIEYTVRNIPKFKDRASWSRDTFQLMRRRACVYQQTNQNIAPSDQKFSKQRTESDRIKDELTVLVYVSHLIFQRKHFM